MEQHTERRFNQVDVFAEAPLVGNPLAVVIDAEGLTTEEMQRFANWTNLSETTFLLPPTSAEADYRVRIFTPVSELPFAGHPTLGTCQVWLDGGGRPGDGGIITQECEAGLIPIRQTGHRLAFRAPPLIRSGPVDDETRQRAIDQVGADPSTVVDAAWIDNGPGWMGLLLRDADAVLDLTPGVVDMDIGVIGPYPASAEAAFELRAFFPKDGATAEDPVTGSLNASAAQWLIGSGRAAAPYLASQGTKLGRRGRVHVDRDDDGEIWIGGQVVTVVRGTVDV